MLFVKVFSLTIFLKPLVPTIVPSISNAPPSRPATLSLNVQLLTILSLPNKITAPPNFSSALLFVNMLFEIVALFPTI